jgi:predicted phosphodiesterase
MFKKVVVASDFHVPFQDDKAVGYFLRYIKEYKPNLLVINGDFLDMYSLSDFERNPDRSNTLQEDLDRGYDLLKQIRQAVGKKCEILILEGNHEARLQRYIWRNKELNGMNCLNLSTLLDLKSLNISFIGASRDYWREKVGHYKVGDVTIMHGDTRLNGAATSKYSGYSAKNTMYNINSSIIIGHCHRLAQVYATTPQETLIGMECGCLCQRTGIANWQQGFVTFELNPNITNPQLHFINNH